MMDENKAQAELEVLKEEFTAAGSNLLLLDKERTQLLQGFLVAQRLEGDVPFYEQFIAATAKSIVALDDFISLFQKILAYVLLLEPAGHRSPQFRDVYARYQLIEKRIQQAAKLRKKEIGLLRKLSRTRLNMMRTVLERIMKRYIHKEFTILLVVVALSQKSDTEVRAIQKRLQREKEKEIAYAAVATSLFFVPVVGTALFFLSSVTLMWLNESTPNYRKLLEMVK